MDTAARVARSGGGPRGRLRTGAVAAGLVLGVVATCGSPPGPAPERRSAPRSAVRAGPDTRISADRPTLVQVEPVIAADPTDPSRLVAATIGLRRPHDARWQDHQTVLVYASRDGGRTWSARPLPALPPAWTAGDPWLVWLADGTVLLSAIAGPSITDPALPPALPRVYRSTDGGWSWDVEAGTPFPAGTAQDHPVLAAGPGPAGRPAVYLVASHAAGPEEGVDVARVDPQTLRGDPVQPLRPGGTQLNLGGAAVLPDGALVVSYYTMRPPRSLRSARLDPATGAWRSTRIRGSILPVGFPSLAVDAGSGRFRGRLYGAWVESPDPGDPRVLLGHSDDGGATWSAPTQVHGDTTPAGRTLPAVAVAPDGAVAVVWQDRRLAGGADCTDLYGAVSVDGGASFLPEVRLSSVTACPTFDENGAAMARFRVGGGDYLGVVGAGPGSFRAIWSDSRTGRYQPWTAELRVGAGGG